MEGTYIGDGSDFIEHVRQRYCSANISMIKEHQENRQKDNIMKIEDEMRKRQQGLTLAEKIEKELEKVKKKAVVSHIGDSFYQPVEEEGNVYYLRRTNLLRDAGRTLNIIDEIEVQEQEEQKQREEEEKRDITFDEFKEKFGAHIEGTAAIDRSAHESAEEDQVEAAKSAKKGTASKRGTEMNKTSQYGEGEEEDRKSYISAAKSSQMNKSKTDMNMSTDTFKFEIPETCHVGMMKKTLIEKLDQKYLLVSHPYPQIEGQMMIFLPKKADQKESDIIMYRDYSLRKRLETTVKPPESKMDRIIASKRTSDDKKKDKKKDKSQFDQKLQCLEIDILNPLADIEWRNFLEVVDEVQGLGWFQILPVGQKSSMPYQFNMLHILPEAKIPVEKLPIDVFIQNQLRFNKKKESQGIKPQATVGKPLTTREEAEILAATQGLFLIPEFDFEHCIYQLNKENMTSDPTGQVTEVYRRCCDFLRLHTRPDVGVTVLISPRWVFVALLTQPYTHASLGMPVYLDGLAFAGLVSLQTVDQVWPATAGLKDDTITISNAFKKSTHVTKIDEETDLNPNSSSAMIM